MASSSSGFVVEEGVEEGGDDDDEDDEVTVEELTESVIEAEEVARDSGSGVVREADRFVVKSPWVS